VHEKAYLHEMPGEQFTNLKEQARSLDIDPDGTR
jgi:pyruvate carboxylase